MGPARRLAALLLVCGCGDDLGAPAFDYPLDDLLRVHQLQAKATHNSYHVAPDSEVPEWQYTHAPLAVQLQEQGVRQLELDIYYVGGELIVQHVPHADPLSLCPTLPACLAEVRAWSDDRPAHHLLVIQIEVKDSVQPEIDLALSALEDQLAAAWPAERIVTPDEVRGDHLTLADALLEAGWPTLGQTRGRVLFAIDDGGAVRDRYLADSPVLEGRLAFVNSAPGDPFAAFAVRNDPIGDAEAIAEALAANMLVRTRADADLIEPRAGDTARRDAALASGAQFVSTDLPAAVAEFDYHLEVPGGTPSRCNPITAPARCTSPDIEDPRFLR
jgi:hypothetical protein